MKLSIVFSLVLAATSVMAMPQQGNSFLLGCKRCWEICDHRKAGAVARGRVIGIPALIGEQACTCSTKQRCPSQLETSKRLLQPATGRQRQRAPGGERFEQGRPRGN